MNSVNHSNVYSAKAEAMKRELERQMYAWISEKLFRFARLLGIISQFHFQFKFPTECVGNVYDIWATENVSNYKSQIRRNCYSKWTFTAKKKPTQNSQLCY